MTKDESLQLKGIAIMMMLWLHLFGTNIEILEECEKSIFLYDGTPIIYAMRKFGRMCVVLYTFLGGYGMYKVFQRCTIKKNGMGNRRRILKLLANYWIVFFIFIATATALNPQEYPGSINKLLLNFTTLNCTYNGTLWFLLPYAILLLFASPIMRLASSLKGCWIFIAAAVAFAVKVIVYSTVIPATNVFNSIAINCVNALGLFFMFFTGAVYARFNILQKNVTHIKQWISGSFIGQRFHISPSLACTSMLVLLFFCRITQGASTLLDPIYILAMIPLFLCIDTPRWSKQVLGTLGSHSTNIWFLHEYILVLSGTAITLFRYPVIIFIILITTCLAGSFVVNAIKKIARI